MNKKLAKLISQLRQAGQRALGSTGMHVQGDESGLTAFELEDRVLYSASPIDFAEPAPEAVDLAELASDEFPQLAAMSATLPQFDLLISTLGLGDATADGDNFTAGELEQFDENTLGPVTDGEFAEFFDLRNFSSNDVLLRDAHDVLYDFTFGTGPTAFDLKAGDVIFSVDGGGTLTGNTTLVNASLDVFVFRPDTIGNFASGEFYLLDDNPYPSQLAGISFVDKPGGVAIPDGTTIPQGTLLTASIIPILNIQSISLYRPAGLNDGVDLFNETFQYINTGSWGINTAISGLHLVQDDMSIGGYDFQEGDFLFSLSDRDQNVGSNGADIDINDVGLMRYNSGNWEATRLFDGSAVGLDGFTESVDAITIGLVPESNTAPTGIALDNSFIDENTDTSGGVTIGTLSAIDAEGGPFTFEVLGTSPFSVLGDQLILTGETLDYEVNSSYPVALRVTDSGGLEFDTSLTIFVNDVNEAPSVTLTNLVNAIPENTTVQTKIADIVVADDNLGTESLALSGADAGYFEIIGNELFVKANQSLDFESKPSLDVTVDVNDSAINGNTIEDSDSHTVSVTDINEAPAIALVNTVPILAEDADTTTRRKVADIQITDDGIGSESLSLSGTDAGSFEIVGTELFLRAGTMLNYEAKSGFDVTVEVDDPTLGSGFEGSADYALLISDVNEAPTVVLQNAMGSVTEGTLGSNLKVADIVVIDDALGTETLVLNGFDSSYFEIIGTELFLKAGQDIDFETNPVLDVTVEVDDATLGTTFEDSASLTMNVLDENDAPTVQLVNTVNQVVENSTAQVKVADIVIMDDSLGTNALGLSGVDANFFEIIGNELYLKAGQDIDFETNPALDVTVEVDDPSIGSSFENSAAHTVIVQDVNEAPTVSLANVISSLDENVDTSSPIKVADIVVSDDALGTETLNLFTGAGGAPFEIVGNELYLQANTDLDFESINQFNVTIAVDDPTLGSTVEDTTSYTLDVADVNEPGSFEFRNILASVSEDTTVQTKVADIVITDDALGSETLTLLDPDSSHFEIIGTELFLKANPGLDFETNPVLDIRVALDDPTLGTGAEDTDPLTLAVTDVNEAPSVALINTVPSLPEDHDTSARTKIADIQITDDALGAENLTLSGADASLFEIDGTELYLRANVALDFETQNQFDVSVQVDDTTLGSTFDDEAFHLLDIQDVNEAPSVELTNVVAAIPENTTVQTKIADIVVSDDALGTETLSLDGSHSGLFEIIGTELFLKAGQDIDFESNAALAVTVKIDDPTLGFSDDDADDINVSVIDVNEAPSVSLVNQITTLPEDHNTSTPTKIADIVVSDDALGSESLLLSGADSGDFEIIGTSLYLKAGVALDFESQNVLDVTVEVDDAAFGSGSEDAESQSVDITDVNEAPTVTLINQMDSILENFDTSSPIKIADIVVADDALGSESLILSGADSNDFEIVGMELYLKANTVLDFESLPSLEVTVSVDDATLGTGVEDSDSHILGVLDENEPPSIQLENTLLTIPEDNSTRTKVADIVISDDALGDETLTLTGPDANLFEIDGLELYLVANANLDHETLPQLNVTIEIDDAAIGTGIEDSDSQSIAVSDVNESPEVENSTAVVNAAEDDADLTIDLSNVFNDVDGDVLTISLGTISDPNVVSANVVGSMLNVDFLDDQYGPVTIDIIADDGEFTTVETVVIDVAPENDSPLILDDASLVNVYRDADPAGELIADVVGSQFADIDGDSLVGIAIVANDATASEGSWQSKGSSNEWRDIGSVSLSSAKILPIGSSIRFLPAPGFTGTPTPLEFHVIDSSFTGTVGGPKTDIGSTGGTSPFSGDSGEIGIQVLEWGVSVSPTSPMVTSEAGQVATFDVVLDGAPTGEVVIPIMSQDLSEGVPSVNELRFTPANWSVPQTVTVSGVDGFVVDGDQPFKIVFGSVQSTDSQYDGINIGSLDYINLDDDVASVVVSENNLQTDENGQTDQFDLELSSQPTSNVIVELSVSDQAEAVLSTSVVEFTPFNWNTPQTVTVTGQNDLLPDGDTSFVITATPVSVDPVFDSLSPVDIDAENLAAIGPVTGTPEVVEAPGNEPNNDDDDVEFVKPPPTEQRDAVETGGVDDFARKPRVVVVDEAYAGLDEEFGDRFEANQYSRQVANTEHSLNYYTERTSVTEQFVNALQLDEEAGMSHLWSELDSLDERINEEADMPIFAVGATASIASVFTAGYLVWLIRGGWILAGVLSSLPMWNSLDMLAVLSKPDEEDEESQSLESLVNEPNSEQQAPSGGLSTLNENAELAQVSV